MKKLLSILVFLCCILFVGEIKSEIRDSDIQKSLYSSNVENKDSVTYLTPQPKFRGEMPCSFIKRVYKNLEYADDAKKMILKVLKKSPRWIPGLVDGKVRKIRYKITVIFNLE